MKKAGTIILLACILIWFLSSYDWGLNFLGTEETNGSMLASIGSALCWIFIPLGWGDNWELTVGAITGLIAKENIIGTFGTIFGIEAGEEGEGLEVFLEAMLSDAGALSFLTFNLLCAPCFAAIGAMHRELGSWKDTGMAVVYQCVFAYAIALLIYGFCGCIGGWNVVDGVDQGIPIGSLIAAIVVLAILIYILWAKDPFRQFKHKDGEASA